jgi:hypothetical protein
MAVGVTYTRARDRGRRRHRLAPMSIGERLLLATSLVIVVAIALTCAGRIRTDGPAASINLNAVTDAAALDAPLATVFAYAPDRRFAARILANSLEQREAPLPNVGALARLQVPADSIDRERAVVAYRDRIDAARRAAADAGRQPPQIVPLFTASELAALKPALAVRTIEEYRATVVWCAIALIVPFHLVVLLWRWRGVPGDRVRWRSPTCWSASAPS